MEPERVLKEEVSVVFWHRFFEGLRLFCWVYGRKWWVSKSVGFLHLCWLLMRVFWRLVATVWLLVVLG